MTVDLKNGAPTGNLFTESREYIFGNRYKMFNDNYRTQVIKRLTDIYSKAADLKMDKQIDMTNNVYKTIVNKISRVYKQGIDREFTDDAMAELYKTSHIDKYMKQANKYVNAFNDILMQVSWDADNGKPRFIFRYPHNTKVVIDDMGNPGEVEYFISIDEKNVEKWAFWSNTEHYYKLYKSDGTFDKQTLDGNENGVNPYDTLPFVFMQNGFRDNTFFDMYTGNDMVEVTLDMAVYNTFKNYLIKWQSFKQLTVTGSNVGAIKGQVLDPSTALTAEGDDISIDVLDLQANLTELRETIDSQMINVAINYNISPSQFRMTGEVSSGFALQMENSNLDEFTVDQQSDFLTYERELYKLIVTVGNTEGASLSEGAEFTPTFADIQYKESSETTVSTQEKRIAIGLTNPITIIQNEMNITEDEAKIEYENNLKIRNQANENINPPTLDTNLIAEAMGIVDATT